MGLTKTYQVDLQLPSPAEKIALAALLKARLAAWVQTYSTTTRTIDPASTSAFTGIDNAQAGTVYAQLSDLNQLRDDLLMAFSLANQLLDDLTD